MSMTFLSPLETPHAVVDVSRLRRNIDRVAAFAKKHGLGLRPHVKTHKDQEIARMQLACGALGVTVATSKEAEVMAEVADDILVAYPPVDPARIKRLLNLPERVKLIVALDSLEAIERLSLALQDRARTQTPRQIRVLIELDLGGARTGVCEHTQLLSLARAAEKSPYTKFSGLMVHPGNLRHTMLDPAQSRGATPDSDRDFRESLALVSERLRSAIAALQAEHFECDIVSGGNTPSLFLSHLVPELTEIRPGTYVYSDRDIAGQGVLDWSDCAYSILATVVSTAVAGQVVIDAGTKALAKEPLPVLSGYGVLLDRPDIVVRAMSEEHGLIDISSTDWRPQVGDRVQVVPNHVCVSVHLQEKVAFLEGEKLTLRSVSARGRSR